MHLSYGDNESLMVYADRDKAQALNIVSNGARHASKHIYIQAGIQNSRVFLTVSDDGEGISEELAVFVPPVCEGQEWGVRSGSGHCSGHCGARGGLITAGNRTEGGAVISVGFSA